MAKLAINFYGLLQFEEYISIDILIFLKHLISNLTLVVFHYYLYYFIIFISPIYMLDI